MVYPTVQPLQPNYGQPLAGYPATNNTFTPDHALFGMVSDTQNGINSKMAGSAGAPGGMGAAQPMPGAAEGIGNFPANGNTLTPNHALFPMISDMHNLINKYSGGLYFQVLGQMGSLDSNGMPELDHKKMGTNPYVNEGTLA